tara:strand:- start:4966 stop:6027 length:1062 start_codon:yes stop_codon:yes gene_type:complete
LTIYSHFSCNIQESLQAYLPVRRYELTLRHRLLDQLGGFSHLLLDALTLMPEQGIGWVTQITGLSGQQLQPILIRLNGLGLVDDDGHLTARAKHLIKCMKLLHGQARHLWLDGQYKKHNFCGSAELTTVEFKDNSEFVIRPWHRGESKPRPWPTFDWNEDCERQKNRIWHYPEQYLPFVFEGFNDCFIETGFPRQDWELSMRVAEDAPRAIALTLADEDLRAGQDRAFRIASPVLCLSTSYSLPHGAPEHLAQLLPDDRCRFATFIDPHEADEAFDPEPDAATSWVWPRLHPDIRESVIAHLFADLERSNDDVPSIFNRQHQVDERWQNLGFDWSSIERRLDIEGIHPIRGGK